MNPRGEAANKLIDGKGDTQWVEKEAYTRPVYFTTDKVCVCVYVYTYTHMYIHTYIYTNTHTNVHKHTYYVHERTACV
jgi:hypothetical protein